MSLEKLMDKYNPLKTTGTNEAKVETTGMQSWKDSAPVGRLSEYLKRHKDQGIYLYQRNGRPYLFFNPGIAQADRSTERWQIAFNMTVLFFEAADDLEYLITKGLIDVPMQLDSRPEDRDAVGPSPASERQGCQHLDLSSHLK